MNRFYTFISITLLLIFFSSALLAQTIKIDAEVRPRYEYRHGYKTLIPDGYNAANYISQRTRLNAFFANDMFKAYVSIQDVRVWGDVNQLNVNDVNGFSVHEAWGQVKLAKVLHLKVGRQEISYDDQRMFGAVGWAQQARSHDAALLKFFFGDNHTMDVGFAYNAMQESLYQVNYTNKNYKALQYIHYHGKFGKSGLSILFLNNGIAYEDKSDTNNIHERIVYSQTFGARYTFAGKRVKADGAFYYQSGKNAKDKALQAYYFSANVYIKAADFFTVGLGFEYLSGTSTIDQKRSDRNDFSFSPFYGTNHKFNGFMDYFYVGNYGGANGLIDLYLPLKFNVKKWVFALIPHYFMAGATVSSFDENTQMVTDYSDALGTEIDFVLGYTISKSVKINAGYSQMLATETMQVVKYPDNIGGEFYKNNNSWGWIMITFKPTFFNSDNKKK